MKTGLGGDIKKAVAWLLDGQLVAIPTETVYGLAALCTHQQAIESVYRVKKRPINNPLVLHTTSLSATAPYVAGPLDPRLESLAARFWPGPLTLLLPKEDSVLPSITAGLPRVAVRVPDHPVALALLSATACAPCSTQR